MQTRIEGIQTTRDPKTNDVVKRETVTLAPSEVTEVVAVSRDTCRVNGNIDVGLSAADVIALTDSTKAPRSAKKK